ncbi:MAG: M50 family metallopeptidase [Longimicrobiales bacterium]|nr:M50 family metallopeptidase [Longimicrobiales bacterium]
MTPLTKKRATFLAGFLLYFVILWALWDTVIIYPVKVFVVLLHEVSHALAAMATGGSVERIVLNANQGGAAYTVGGIPFVTLSAGYLGSLLWGVIFVMLGFSRWLRPRWIIAGVGVFVLFTTASVVRSPFGLLFGLAFGAALLASSRYFSQRLNRILLLGLGLTSTLYAILDIKSDILARPELRSDAAMLAEMTGIHTVIWGFLWIAIALLVSAWLLRWVARRMDQFQLDPDTPPPSPVS